MSGVFGTKWDFLHASVLIGVDRSTGVFSGSEPTPGQQMVCVWTSEEIATEALHVESWELRPIAVRDLLSIVPAGVGVQVDPERPTGMTATASYVANLRRYVPAFPAGTEVRVSDWGGLSGAVRAAVTDAVAHDDRVRELHAFGYTVDDSPALGCLVVVVDPSGGDDAVGAVEATLRASADPADLGVGAVAVLRMDELPDEIRDAIGDRHLVHRRRRSRPWRR